MDTPIKAVGGVSAYITVTLEFANRVMLDMKMTVTMSAT
jgi:hypothetical protein